MCVICNIEECSCSHCSSEEAIIITYSFFLYIYFADRASLYIYLNIKQLDALNFYNKFISCLYMFRAHVLIVRRSKLYYTASGIIIHCRWPSGENIFYILLTVNLNIFILILTNLVH